MMKKKLLNLLSLLILFFCFNPLSAQFETRLTGEEGGGWTGHTIAFSHSGDTMAVSSPYSGYIQVFSFDNGSWTLVGNNIPGHGSSLSLSANGKRVAFTGGGNLVQIFEWDGVSWSQLGNDIQGNSREDNFGGTTFWPNAVSLSGNGDRIAIGTSDNRNRGSIKGYVKVFDLQNGAWVQLGPDLVGDSIADYFGVSVSLAATGNILAVGAEGGYGKYGYARLFEWNGQDWLQKGADIEGENGSYCGRSVSLSANGTRVAVGENLYSVPNGEERVGRVRVYDWTRSQ
jgi:hypothetical protein